jgi:hypothetical protein
VGLLIGMDEAGLGPNLGPLVVTVTVWEVPGLPREFDFWGAMSNVASQMPTKEPLRLQIADSKQVYSPGKGLAVLEKSVLAALRMLDRQPQSLAQLCEMLRPASDSEEKDDGHRLSTIGFRPEWLRLELALPTENETSLIGDVGTKWLECCQRTGVTLKAIRSEIVQPERFNAIVRACDNKSLALSQISLGLLRSVWNPDDPQPTLVICDKHGGRNRYDDLLSEILDGRMIFSIGEAKERSVYRVGSTELRFQMKAEANFPVALASLVCKYVRELSMLVFNRFWAELVPGLKPTAGYPVDAVRFRSDIAEAQQRLGLPDDVLWRER